MPVLKRMIGLCLVFSLCIGVAIADEVQLGAPPLPPPDLSGLLLPPQEKAELEFSRDFQATPPLNPQSREASRSYYYSVYLASGSQPIMWDGDRAVCAAGSTALDYKEAVALRINYFRAMAGVPSQIAFSDTYSGKDQKAALMMSANNALDHYPPDTWSCYSAEGAEGAGNSNLALGASGWDSISLYVKDPGSNNGAAGHRRWILYPQTQQMGTGDIPPAGGSAANALWVFDDNIWNPRSATREEYVAWPPPGYVPYQVVYPRWSFAYAGADFSQATVTMTNNQQPVSTVLETIYDGYGENTLVWIPAGLTSWDAWPQPAADTRYRITIDNVVIAGTPRSFTYDVTVFDPATEQPPVFSLNPVYLLLLGD